APAESSAVLPCIARALRRPERGEAPNRSAYPHGFEHSPNGLMILAGGACNGAVLTLRVIAAALAFLVTMASASVARAQTTADGGAAVRAVAAEDAAAGRSPTVSVAPVVVPQRSDAGVDAAAG